MLTGLQGETCSRYAVVYLPVSSRANGGAANWFGLAELDAFRETEHRLALLSAQPSCLPDQATPVYDEDQGMPCNLGAIARLSGGRQ